MSAPDNARYAEWAAAALALYEVVPERVEFLGHNSGVAYRVTARDWDQALLLKVHRPRGSSGAIAREYVEGVLVWLDDLSHMPLDFPVQRPIADAEGRLLPHVHLRGVGVVACSLQTWVEGEPAEEDLTESQAVAIGAMTARLHACGSRWVPSRPVAGQILDGDWFATRLVELGTLVDPDLATATDRQVLEGAGQVVAEALRAAGRSSATFGPVHGDLHQENIVFRFGSPRPIDFAYLMFAPYAWDLGVLAYHTMHLPLAVRRALVESYVSSRAIATAEELALETFLVASAIDNLAFQVSIPEQRTSLLLQRNLDQLIHRYCPSLIAGEPFVLT